MSEFHEADATSEQSASVRAALNRAPATMQCKYVDANGVPCSFTITDDRAAGVYAIRELNKHWREAHPEEWARRDHEGRLRRIETLRARAREEAGKTQADVGVAEPGIEPQTPSGLIPADETEVATRIAMEGRPFLNKLKRQQLEAYLRSSPKVNSKAAQNVIFNWDNDSSNQDDPYALYRVMVYESGIPADTATALVTKVFNIEKKYAQQLMQAGGQPIFWNPPTTLFGGGWSEIGGQGQWQRPMAHQPYQYPAPYQGGPYQGVPPPPLGAYPGYPYPGQPPPSQPQVTKEDLFRFGQDVEQRIVKTLEKKEEEAERESRFAAVEHRMEEMQEKMDAKHEQLMEKLTAKPKDDELVEVYMRDGKGNIMFDKTGQALKRQVPKSLMHIYEPLIQPVAEDKEKSGEIRRLELLMEKQSTDIQTLQRELQQKDKDLTTQQMQHLNDNIGKLETGMRETRKELAEAINAASSRGFQNETLGVLSQTANKIVDKFGDRRPFETFMKMSGGAGPKNIEAGAGVQTEKRLAELGLTTE